MPLADTRAPRMPPTMALTSMPRSSETTGPLRPSRRTDLHAAALRTEMVIEPKKNTIGNRQRPAHAGAHHLDDLRSPSFRHLPFGRRLELASRRRSLRRWPRSTRVSRSWSDGRQSRRAATPAIPPRSSRGRAMPGAGRSAARARCTSCTLVADDIGKRDQRRPPAISSPWSALRRTSAIASSFTTNCSLSSAARSNALETSTNTGGTTCHSTCHSPADRSGPRLRRRGRGRAAGHWPTRRSR